MVPVARRTWVIVGVVVTLLAACGSSEEATPPVVRTPTATPAESSYCSDLAELTTVIDEGGALGRYHRLLQRIGDESPPEHAATWSLMLTLSLEDFTYENNNAAINSLDDITPDLEQRCPALGQFTVGEDTQSFDVCPLATFDQIVATTPDARAETSSAAVEPLVADNMTSNFSAG